MAVIKGKEEPIYEKLGPKECLIVSRDEEGIFFACNEDGKPRLKKVRYSEATG